jgi:hypothetical protein
MGYSANNVPVLLLQLSPENVALPPASKDIWGLLYIGVLITVLWLGFRKIKGFSDEPENKAEDPKSHL